MSKIENDAFSWEHAKFRWERQKFMLMLVVITMIGAMALMLFVRQGEKQRDIESYASVAVQRALKETEELKVEVRLLAEKNVVLEKKVADAESLITALQKNQEAQQALLRQFSERRL